MILLQILYGVFIEQRASTNTVTIRQGTKCVGKILQLINRSRS